MQLAVVEFHAREARSSAERLSILFVTGFDTRHKGGGGAYSTELLKLLRSDAVGADVDYDYLQHPLEAAPTLRRAWTSALGLARLMPAHAAYKYWPTFGRRLRARVASGAYDLVVLNSTDLFWCDEALAGLPTPRLQVCHNVEHALYAQRIEFMRIPGWAKSLMRSDAQRFREREIAGVRRIGRMICLSSDDAAVWRRLAPGAEVFWLPCFFSYPPANRQARRLGDGPLQLGFLGKLDWWPNQEALVWFCREVLPHVPAHLHVFGMGRLPKGAEGPKVTYHGFAPDIQDVWRQVDATICPVFSGSGVNVKFAESIYNRVPVIATATAKRGLEVTLDPGIVILDEKAAWIDFLRSERAQELRRCVVSDAAARAFDAGVRGRRLADFLHGAAASRPPQEKRVGQA